MTDDLVVSELKAAGASLILAMAAAENMDWAAAEQGVEDAGNHIERIKRELASKLASGIAPQEEKAVQPPL